jgi:EAL domain-containing protein (putative c-di-GMP-specific phosphodiesterase class I)
VKIDLSFVREITSLSDRPPVITNMIAMIHALEKRAVAEGVETEQQLGALTAMGCDVVQGYLLGRPKPLSPSI